MKLSLFSVSYAGLWGQHSLSTTDFITKAATLGYDSVMLMAKRPHLSPLDSTDQSLDNIMSTLKQNNITCSVIAAYTDFSNSTAAEVPYLEMQLLYIKNLAQIARKLGAPYIRIFTAYESKTESLTATWNRTVTAVREAVDIAADYNVTIALQNHHDLAVHSDVMLELLCDIDQPKLKLGFDAWSPALRSEDLYQAAKKMAPHTAITTNADYIRLPRYQYQPDQIDYKPVTPHFSKAVPFGQGFIDYKSFFQGLKDGGFNNIASFESCSPLRGGGSEQNLDHCASTYLKWMKQNTT